jgi:hypothetical protein
MWSLYPTSSGTLLVLNGAGRSPVRSTEVIAPGPDTNLIASLPIAYISACHASGGSGSGGRSSAPSLVPPCLLSSQPCSPAFARSQASSRTVAPSIWQS